MEFVYVNDVDKVEILKFEIWVVVEWVFVCVVFICLGGWVDIGEVYNFVDG